MKTRIKNSDGEIGGSGSIVCCCGFDGKRNARIDIKIKASTNIGDYPPTRDRKVIFNICCLIAITAGESAYNLITVCCICCDCANSNGIAYP